MRLNLRSGNEGQKIEYTGTNRVALSIKNIWKSYGDKAVLHGVDVDVPEHSFVSIIGESGSGKTSILKIIAGLEKPDKGQIYVDSNAIVDDKVFLKPEKRGMGMVFQEYTLFPHMTIKENILYGVKGSQQKKNDVLEEMMNLIKLNDLLDKYPHMISGGQQQRAAIARALAPKPRFLLLDEPFSNLDQKTRKILSEEFFTLLKKEGITAVLVTHDQDEAFTYSDIIVILKDGLIEQTGKSEEVYHYPKSEWVADFLGNANFIPLNSSRPNCFLKQITEVCAICGNSNNIMIRPEDITVTKGSDDYSHGKIEKIEFRGSYYLASVRLVGGELLKINLQKNHSHQVNEEVLISASSYHVF